MSSDKNARKHHRYPVKWGVDIDVPDWQKVQTLTTDNISRGGLFVRTETKEIDIGSTVRVSLKLPDGMSVEVDGEVVHVIKAQENAEGHKTAAGFGVRFDEKHATDLSLLEAMAASHAAGPNTYDMGSYISMDAVFRRLADGAAHRTSAYQLVSERREDDAVPLDESAIVESKVDSSIPGAPPAAIEDSGGFEVVEVAPDIPDIDLDMDEEESEPALPTVHPDEAIFGIDFGTSYSSIALVVGDQLMVLHDEEGQTLLPSAVCYTGKDVLVGWPAREKQLENPMTTFVSPKRLIGKNYDDRAVAAFVGGSSVPLEKGPGGQIIAKVFGDPISLPQVCAELFKRLASIASSVLGIPVKRVVLSSPVAYEDEKKAIERAAKFAGLEVVGFLVEPYAAAVSYGLGRQDQKVAVFDFGGGTFDFTLLEIKDGNFNVLGEAGDAWLGGDDFDNVLAEWAANKFYHERKVELRNREVEWQRLLFLCERAKRKLSFEQKTTITAKGILLSIHGPIDLSYELTRQELEEISAPLIQRAIDTMDGCFELAGITPADVDEIVMTGGVSRMPIVRQRVAQFFGKELNLSVDPEQAIVVGNALYGRFKVLSEIAEKKASQ